MTPAERMAELEEVLRTIAGARTFDCANKWCRWCGSGKAGFHYHECPRTIATLALRKAQEAAK